MPAKISVRNQLRSYARNQLTAGISRARDGAFMAANLRPSLCSGLTTPIFAMANLVFFGPRSSCLHRAAMFLTPDPRFESLFINLQIENTRRAEQFPKRLHYLRRR